jgi:hypothetical protein
LAVRHGFLCLLTDSVGQRCSILETLFKKGGKMSIIIINFAHPLTEEHIQQIEDLIGQEVEKNDRCSHAA